ncbi:MAG TPA: 1-(5-phosphoribosyl)-5-[(5-phosphoribosylamino)methylideneamino]imidazole-4-carboxamide isomerase [Nitrospiria bacterium]|jgi:phosphoribosylformimino-5-aminoimidazole carboxamide ribotide isomerase|nr:1-(5-phosphoribosyl)-5-[(5-phosphoribosylamino)methylideneamino]imidazole-4-carboxamide isomerase [Nitrospiria bacterium]
MLIIPAIDIKDGKCIRLRQGRLGTESIYSDDPLAVAQRWESEGAELIHVVDLDGAFKGRPINHELIVKMIQTVDIPIQVAGGIRTLADIEYYRQKEASRLVLGTKAMQSLQFLKSACDLFPIGISVGLDARDGKIVVQGWTQPTGESVIDFAKKLTGLRIVSIIFTDVQRDGMLKGPNLEAVQELARSGEIPVIASGGVASLEDIDALLTLESSGVAGVIIGKALYTGAFKLSEAISRAQGAH